MTARDVIISCAVTGGGDTTSKSPYVPVTPKEIAESAIGAARAGAAIAHIHVRDPQTGKASMEDALYAEVVQRIRESGVDLLINLTTGAGARFTPDPDDPMRATAASTMRPPARRTSHVEALKPEICSLDVATMNFGEHAFVNVPGHLREMAARITEAGVKPELEVFDLGHIRLARRLLDDGDLPSPPFFQLCLGVPWGAPASARVMELMRDLLPDGALWSAFGIGPHQFPMVAEAVRLGGQVRVGLEDNLYLERGVLAESNAALVERAVEIVREAGGRPATPVRARAMLSLRAASA